MPQFGSFQPNIRGPFSSLVSFCSPRAVSPDQKSVGSSESFDLEQPKPANAPSKVISERPATPSSSEDEFAEAESYPPAAAPSAIQQFDLDSLPTTQISAVVSSAKPEASIPLKPETVAPAEAKAPIVRQGSITRQSSIRKKSATTLEETSVPAKKLPDPMRGVLTSKRRLPDPKLLVLESLFKDEQVADCPFLPFSFII